MTLTPQQSDDRALLVDAVRAFARHELLPAASRIDAGDAERRSRCWEVIGELGLDRGLAGERAGGSALPPETWLVLIEELAAAEPGLALAVALANLAVAAFGEEAVAVPAGERWLLVPAGDGSISERDGVLHGVVRGALGAAAADGIVVTTTGGTVRAVLRPGDDRWSVVADGRQLGLRGAPAADVRLMGAPAAGPHELHGDDRGAPLRPLLLAAVAAVADGIARRAHELAVGYAALRRQGGGPIGRYGAVRQMLAGMEVELRTRGCRSDGVPSEADALAAKVAASDAAARTTIDAVQIFGGTGYMCETGVEKLMRDAKYCQLYPEPNWRLRAALAGLDPALPPAAGA